MTPENTKQVKAFGNESAAAPLKDLQILITHCLYIQKQVPNGTCFYLGKQDYFLKNCMDSFNNPLVLIK